MKLVVQFFAQTLFHSTGEGTYGLTHQNSENRPPVGFEEETQIPHARLAHFPAQIGHWGISSRIRNHNR